ncbi:SAM-dependent methyltransferase [Trebonia kvetii]|uniref:SAM-dependent methyltransferase n=1 Tax=Trebonia kvetii TaxID=2480626 RepID=A0A6P2BZN6_9ACTN|nr:SAM-dependent methyltransferase [Trebonia kvetii]TVZ04582.1 SAM-dependent methyltransferase [Trebonia kvetii]
MSGGSWDDMARWERAGMVDAASPSVVRAADYLDGGGDNFDADRKAVRAMISVAPVIAMVVPALRAFHRRVVRYLVAEAGITQFLDIGAGLPASGLTHKAAQSLDPACRIVYVTGDPMVLAHARALAKSTPGGIVDYVDAHFGDLDAIYAGAGAVFDLRRPVALMFLSTSVFGRIADTKEATAALSGLLAGLPSGSYVALYHQASDMDPSVRVANRRWNRQASQKITLRSREEVASLVAGLELVPPGLVHACDWRPAPDDPVFDAVIPLYGVVARKP